jgi:hypothetical protein
MRRRRDRAMPRRTKCRTPADSSPVACEMTLGPSRRGTHTPILLLPRNSVPNATLLSMKQITCARARPTAPAAAQTRERTPSLQRLSALHHCSQSDQRRNELPCGHLVAARLAEQYSKTGHCGHLGLSAQNPTTQGLRGRRSGPHPAPWCHGHPSHLPAAGGICVKQNSRPLLRAIRG